MGLFSRAFVYGFHIHCRLEGCRDVLVRCDAMQGFKDVVQAGSLVLGRFLAVLWAVGGFPGIPAAVPQSTGGHTRVIRPTIHFVRFTMVLLSNILFSSVFWWCLCFFVLRGSYWAFCAFAFLAANWLLWLWVFHRLRAPNSGNHIVRWIGNRLNKGTALQFFVQEIEAAFGDQRENSPTNGASVLGVATGSAVMALIYGPGISFLFSNRGKPETLESSDVQAMGSTDGEELQCRRYFFLD